MGRLIVIAAVLAALTAPTAVRAGDGQAGESIEAGVHARWSYEPRSQPGLGALEVDLSSETTGAPLSFGRGELVGWLQRSRSALSDAEPSCADRVKSLASSGVGRKSDIDLNEYRLMTLNSDGSVAVINPFVGLNGAKLESIVDLGGAPKTWLQIPERAELWVVIDNPSQLVTIDLHTRAITRRIALPTGGDPRGLAFDGAGTLWIALPGAGGFGALELTASEVQPHIAPARSAAAVIDPKGLPGVVTLESDGSVALWRGLSPERRWRVPGTPTAAAYSVLTRQLIVATLQGDLFWLDPEGASAQAARTLSLGRRIDRLALFDDGRRALVFGDQASLVDLAVASETLVLQTDRTPDDVVLTSNFAYAVFASTGRATLWRLEDLRNGNARPLDVVIGSGTDGASTNPSAGLSIAAAAPGGSGMFYASAKDAQVFQYAEGMMAPTGGFSNYRRGAVALAVLDQSLQPVGPGRYRTAVRHSIGGHYRLTIAGARPRFSLCAEVDLPMVPEQPEEDLTRLRAVLIGVPSPAEDVSGPPSEAIRVRVDSVAPSGAATALVGVTDLRLLVFDRRTGWQRRSELVEISPGAYEALVAVPRSAQYEAMVSSASRNLSFIDGRIGELPLGRRP